MQTAIDRKEANVSKALKGRVNVNEAVMIGGDLFSMGYMAFQGAQVVKPSLALIPAIGITTLTCGVIAGVINIGVALISLKEALQASKNGDMNLALRLFLDFLGLFAIGSIMILASLAIRVATLGALGVFFEANPWLLPVLFFIISIPILLEISNRIHNIRCGKDLAAQLNRNLDELIYSQDQESPFHIDFDLSDKETYNRLAKNIEKLQANMGVEAAIETFKLLRLHILNEATEKQFQIVKGKVAKWNRAQYVRMFQQILYAAAFGVSMAALTPKINIPAVNGTETFAMAAANAIPLYMDIFWPFRRNTPIVVPHVMDMEMV